MPTNFIEKNMSHNFQSCQQYLTTKSAKCQEGSGSEKFSLAKLG